VAVGHNAQVQVADTSFVWGSRINNEASALCNSSNICIPY